MLGEHHSRRTHERAAVCSLNSVRQLALSIKALLVPFRAILDSVKGLLLL